MKTTLKNTDKLEADLEEAVSIINENGLWLPIEHLKKNSRVPEIVAGRAMVVKYLRKKEYSFAVIGGILGRDHATMMHSQGVFKKIIKNSDSPFYEPARAILMEVSMQTKRSVIQMIDYHKKQIEKLESKLSKL